MLQFEHTEELSVCNMVLVQVLMLNPTHYYANKMNNISNGNMKQDDSQTWSPSSTIKI